MNEGTHALEVAYLAVEEAIRLGANYADSRHDLIDREDLRVQNGQMVRASHLHERGVGLRVLVDGVWGFVALSEPTRHDAIVAARRAVANAKAGAILTTRAEEVVESDPVRGLFRTTVEQSPWDVPLEEKVSLLLELNALLAAPAEVVVARSRFYLHRMHRLCVTSDGAEIDQEIHRIELGMEAGASDGERLRLVAHPDGSVLSASGAGWEILERQDLKGTAQVLSGAAVEQLSARPLPRRTRTLIVSSAVAAAHLASLIPLLRLDRVLGDGPSAPILDDRIGSEDVEVVSHPGWSFGAGSHGYDDEGVPAEPIVLVDGGRVTAGLSSRGLAARLGFDRSSGSMRTGHWSRSPTVCPSNLVMASGGADSVESLIADTREGIYVESLAALALFEDRYVATPSRAWLLKDGRRQHLVCDISYGGRVQELLAHVVEVASSPSPTNHAARFEGSVVGLSAPPLKLTGVEVGPILQPGLPRWGSMRARTSSSRFRSPRSLARKDRS
ncbi:MAG: TldD/PmbA family protein [Myxococcales bacterium]|nr:TldD/PmbA family protein [Myxococcales bacterium]